MFECYYKNHVKFLMKKISDVASEANFFNFLNGFMNNLMGRKKEFLKSQIRMLLINEVSKMWCMVETETWGRIFDRCFMLFAEFFCRFCVFLKGLRIV